MCKYSLRAHAQREFKINKHKYKQLSVEMFAEWRVFRKTMEEGRCVYIEHVAERPPTRNPFCVFPSVTVSEVFSGC
jgi:hypothetical protein